MPTVLAIDTRESIIDTCEHLAEIAWHAALAALRTLGTSGGSLADLVDTENHSIYSEARAMYAAARIVGDLDRVGCREVAFACAFAGEALERRNHVREATYVSFRDDERNVFRCETASNTAQRYAACALSLVK